MAVFLYKNDRSFWRYTPAQSDVRSVPCNSTGARQADYFLVRPISKL